MKKKSLTQGKQVFYKYAFLIIATALLVVWLFGGGNIVRAVLLDGNYMAEINEIDAFRNDRILTALDEAECIDSSLAPVAVMSGWAYAEKMIEYDELCPGKLIEVILYDELQAHGYRVGTMLTRDVFGLKSGDYNRFSLEFPLLGMRDGVYRIYSYSYETEGIYGVGDTRKFLCIRDGSMEIAGFQSAEIVVNMNDVQHDGSLMVAIDEFDTEGENIVCSGWIVKEGMHTDGRQVILALIDASGQTRFFSTNSVERSQLNVVPDPRDYQWAGFKAVIPKSDYEGIDINTRSMALVVLYEGAYTVTNEIAVR